MYSYDRRLRTAAQPEPEAAKNDPDRNRAWRFTNRFTANREAQEIDQKIAEAFKELGWSGSHGPAQLMVSLANRFANGEDPPSFPKMVSSTVFAKQLREYAVELERMADMFRSIK